MGEALTLKGFMSRSYENIDPGMYPSDLAECLEDLANEYLEGSGELECKHKSQEAALCQKTANILFSAAEKLRKLD